MLDVVSHPKWIRQAFSAVNGNKLTTDKQETLGWALHPTPPNSLRISGQTSDSDERTYGEFFNTVRKYDLVVFTCSV